MGEIIKLENYRKKLKINRFSGCIPEPIILIDEYSECEHYLKLFGEMADNLYKETE